MTTISPPPAVPPSNRRGALALALPLLVVAGCLLFYAGLVPLGYWQGDEFLTIRSIEEYGLSSLTWRLTTWSPRPISEGLLYSYMTLVLSSGRQLIAPMLGVLWCLLGLAIILPAALARRFNATSIIASIIVFGGVLAQPLSSRFTYDVFYWIQGAAAYVPTIAAFIAVLGLIIFGSTRSNPIRISVAIILCGAAMASEVGAFFVLIFTSLTFVLHIIQRLFNGKPDRTRSSYICI